MKISAKIASHGRYVTFQLAEVAVPRSLFQEILGLIDDLRRRPAPAQAEGIDGEEKATREVCLDGEKKPNGLLDTANRRKSSHLEG